MVTAWPGKITRRGEGSLLASSEPTEVPTRDCRPAAPQEPASAAGGSLDDVPF